MDFSTLRVELNSSSVIALAKGLSSGFAVFVNGNDESGVRESRYGAIAFELRTEFAEIIIVAVPGAITHFEIAGKSGHYRAQSGVAENVNRRCELIIPLVTVAQIESVHNDVAHIYARVALLHDERKRSVDTA